MVNLPDDFVRLTRELMGEQRFARYMAAFDEDAPVSIRLNPRKNDTLNVKDGEPVPWCDDAYYLPKRPNFTFDPLLHAGCYYVQEAASMFLHAVLKQHLPSHPVTMLDLCAAPGGKSTLACSVLPTGSSLWSNEPVRQRANILLENIQKWGYDQCHVSSCYPCDYRKSKLLFDVILCDVPCSGEGMFRKDPATIAEWSTKNVERCWQLQREIVGDAWQCLRPGGLLVYSTCTFNTKENEANIAWMLTEFDATVLPVETKPEWNICGSLLSGFSQPVYRFIPGITRGEGLFMCVLRKGGRLLPVDGEEQITRRHAGKAAKGARQGLDGKAAKGARQGIAELQPLPLHTDGPAIELTYEQAIAFLRHESLLLPPDAPRGLVEVCYKGHGLGMVKNIGSRANNLYPKEWRIKATHIPQEMPVIVS